MQYSFLLKCIFIHMAINYSQIVLRGKKFNFFVSPRTIIVYFFLRNFHIWQEFIAATRDIHRLLQTIQMKLILLCVWALVTQPMLQRRPNRTELRWMDYYHQIFCDSKNVSKKFPTQKWFCKFFCSHACEQKIL